MEVIDDSADGSGLIAVGSEECTVCLLQVQVLCILFKSMCCAQIHVHVSV